MIACIVFDFDGTLVDSNASKRSAFYEVLLPLGLPAVALDRVFRLNPDADRHGIISEAAQLLDDAGISAEASALTDRYAFVTANAQVLAPEITGASQMLGSLSQKFPLYLNSATPEDALKEVIQRRGWAHFFRGTFGRPASKPENLNRICQREGLSPSQLLMVGDQRVDESAAAKAGCLFVAVGDLACSTTGPRLLSLAELEHFCQSLPRHA